MVANRIAFFILLPALCFLYLAWDVNPAYAPGIVPFIVLAVLVYILAPQINWWWYQRWPPDLNKELTQLLEKFFPFYQKLPSFEKKRFRTRVAMFKMGVEWMPKGFPEDILPPDIATMLAAQAVMLTFGKSEYLFKQFEKVIVYPLPFPSPEYPFAHASELYAADGCLLFSAQQIARSFVQPYLHFNIGLYEYARVFILTHPNENYPDCSAVDLWAKLEQISNMDRRKVELTIGLADIEPLPVLIHHYFMFHTHCATLLPDETAQLAAIFFQVPTDHDTLYIHAT